MTGFIESYGPWAIVAGASEGTGRSYAEQLAAMGMSLILIARRSSPLESMADALRAQYGIECLTASIDLAQADAHLAIQQAVGNREVGLFISNAGSDPNGKRFLDADAASWKDLLIRNSLTTMMCCHHFGTAMRARGRGGLLLANSYACYGGGQFMACYSGSKAFELCFAESLWSELRPFGVDVLTVVMGTTDTPMLRQVVGEKRMESLIPFAASPDDVARFALANLKNGPVQNFGLTENEAGVAPTSAAERRARVEMNDAHAGMYYDA